MDFTTTIPAVPGAARGLDLHLVDALLERDGGSAIVNVLSLRRREASPAGVAARLLDGLAAGAEDIFLDANAEAMSSLWCTDPKAERALAGV